MDRRGLVAFIFIAALGGAAWWWFKAPTVNNWPITNNPPGSSVIVVFGDSLASGHGAGNPQAQGPAALLEERFDRRVIDLGRSGDETDQGIKRLNSVRVINPGLVIVSLGGNDFLRRRRRDEIFDNLRKIVVELQKTGAVVCLVGLEPAASLGYSYTRDFRDLAKETGALLVPDALSGILTNAALRSDAIHPNTEGYKLFSERIGDVIEPVVAAMPISNR